MTKLQLQRQYQSMIRFHGPRWTGRHALAARIAVATGKAMAF